VSRLLVKSAIYDAVDRTDDLWAISQGVAKHELTSDRWATPPGDKAEWCCLEEQ